MRVIRNLDSGILFSKPVLTLGTFDGVHLGHQEILRNLAERARKNGKESVLFTFDPHPRIILDPINHSVKLIDTLEERLKKLEETRLDTVILFPFTKEFSQLSACAFVEEILVNKLDVSEMFVGYDHHFGKNRSGNFNELKQLGTAFDFRVSQIEAVQLESDSISSTKIRKAISEGNTLQAMRFLGVPYQFSGEVIKGNQLGRTIGFPTANVSVKEETKLIPAHGVYAVRIEINSNWYKGVMNIGTKPTVQDALKTTIEVFIFDFSTDIYGEEIRVLVYDFIRSEQRFSSIEELKLQLKKDEKTARNLLRKY